MSNLMQPIAGNRGGERRRWYQEQVMHAGIRQQRVSPNMEKDPDGDKRVGKGILCMSCLPVANTGFRWSVRK